MTLEKINMVTKQYGVLKFNEPMSGHTSWRIGGVAEQFFLPESLLALSKYLFQIDNSISIYWLGLGSNLLVRDAGISGVVICTSGVLNDIQFMKNNQVRIEAGVAAPKMSKKCADNALSGVEFLSGIPGTIGGALFMNAGALGKEIWDFVVAVETINRRGEIRVRTRSEFDVCYRQVSGKGFELGLDEWFVSGTFQLSVGDTKQTKENIKAILQHRSATQPTQLANAGSVFRNPEGQFAAKIIEDLGLKGFCIGGACISEKHANFIINTGTASSSDVESLIQYIYDLVYKNTGIKLLTEVQIVGDKY